MQTFKRKTLKFRQQNKCPTVSASCGYHQLTRAPLMCLKTMFFFCSVLYENDFRWCWVVLSRDHPGNANGCISTRASYLVMPERQTSGIWGDLFSLLLFLNCWELFWFINTRVAAKQIRSPGGVITANRFCTAWGAGQIIVFISRRAWLLSISVIFWDVVRSLLVVSGRFWACGYRLGFQSKESAFVPSGFWTAVRPSC